MYKSKINKKHLSQLAVNFNGANESNVRTNNPALSLNLPKLRIPNFSGDSSTYLEFINCFTNAIDANESLNNVDKFIYLKSFLSGEASKIVSGFALTEDNYKSCLNLLKDKYGRQNHLISCFMNKLLEIEPVKSSFNLKGLRKLHDESEINIGNLYSMGVASGNYGHLLIPILLKQLPHDLVVEFHRQKDSKNIGDVKELMKFIKFEIESRESANIASTRAFTENSRYLPRNLSYQPQQPKLKNNFPSSSALTTVVRNVCIFCNSDTHTSIGCQIFSNEEKRYKLKRVDVIGA
ncbi:integrase catalytic domain-containing protein [Trichonephila clavata]|uniref:Integrase catalytic domain-containing protein n=1 Tax=Trichonephila clavata TaxID=2740835 RepID=A0A8X6K7U6_TRICU|nr:integrase catalytic domain-containing protein [Trichonephila clavata]